MNDNGGPIGREQLVPAREARQAWARFRGRLGFAPNPTNLLTHPSAQPKAGKSETPTYVLHLAPSDATGMWDVCPWATDACRAACLNTAGRGRFDSVQEGRKARTRFLGADPYRFMSLLWHEIGLARKRHDSAIAVRLNGTSDIRWEKLAPFLFAESDLRTIWYDYTKHKRRDVPGNYHLTYSVSERDSIDDIEKMIDRYGRVAVVFDTPKSQQLPMWWQGLPVVDGDKDDQRWLDQGVVVGLRAKGDAIGDTSGFVRPGVDCTERDPSSEWIVTPVHFRKEAA